MFSYLNGKIAEIGMGTVTVDVGGVGFSCNASIQTLSRVEVGSVAKLYTYLNVREDALELFGFYDRDELEMFRLLISISGVGPKVALSILSAVTPSQLVLALTTGEDKPILAANGVGKKLAGRIILELRDKVAKASINVKDIGVAPVAMTSASAAQSEAMEALISLGYGKDEISSALRGADVSEMSTEDIIKLALARLMR